MIKLRRYYLCKPSYSKRISAFLRTSSYSSLTLANCSDNVGWSIGILQIGHKEKPNVIRGPTQRFIRTCRQQCRWNTWPHCNWIAGAQDRASVKQIMHMSSASCFKSVPDTQRWRQGKQVLSFLTPPQMWPQEWIMLHAFLACSWQSWSAQILPIASKPVFPVVPQNLQIPVVAPTGFLGAPSRNSTNAFSVLLSAKAKIQNSFVLPQPSWRSTRIASSSSLHTCLRCVLVFLWRCKILSHSAHKLPQTLHWIIAVVSSSSWLLHVGCKKKQS